jgi:hypothetical protein
MYMNAFECRWSTRPLIVVKDPKAKDFFIKSASFFMRIYIFISMIIGEMKRENAGRKMLLMYNKIIRRKKHHE